ncbi:methylated-DNA--[protein]-cysteine S-methyltransferase [Oscillatoria sp. FACHB-1407]|uniref:methylated-DNA--[protein]-cysteine S-methyltransferase n=1 Tax=Oscillatoria sp. FACHB-1407 TaxID=2692847 RepID=UPI001685BC0B|nr:methylated-DNA--[protein]-cysteine S-methyltransferase [Oscillatoria sp. FACHB-1407]MBD2464730.1 methylated-DNA--[protein]-cysteine S-methyltransferase [Oscillatoria sp. FACHB-1407]
MELLIDTIATEIGSIFIVSDGESLCALDYVDYEDRMRTLLTTRYGSFHVKPTTDPMGASSQLQAYFQGHYTALDAIAVNPGGTAFQRQVWSALRTIPAGTTVSYGALAAQLGKPTAYRAVGMANSLNPVSIIIPCHRVIGVNAALTGYAGGLERKRWLLRHEGVDVAQLGTYSEREKVKG